MRPTDQTLNLDMLSLQEPELGDLLNDPIMDMLMASDGLVRADILPLIQEWQRHIAA